MYSVGEISSDLLEREREKENIKIKHYGNSNKCYIFFSSNAIYYPNTREQFEETIIRNDRYEWENLASSESLVQNSGMHIFVRDVYKQWYVEGINTRINSIEKLLDYLKALTEGYEVITVGNSAGGYMAVIAAGFLNALQCFNFAGQVSLEEFLERNFLLQAAREDISKNKYFNIQNIYRDMKCDVYYFYAALNKEDCKSYGQIENYKNVKGFGFKQTIHGVSMFADNMVPILCKTEKEMDRLATIYKDKEISRWEFLLRTTSFSRLIYVVWRYVIKVLKMGRGGL